MEVALLVGARRPALRLRRANSCAPRAKHCGSELKGERVLETIWLPPRDSNPDNLLQRQVS